MFWVALWLVLLIGAAVVLGLVTRSVYRKAVDLMHELGDASEKLAALAPRDEDVQRAAAAAASDLAVFADPVLLRREHERRRRGGRPRRGEPGSAAARHRAAAGGTRIRPGRARAT